MIPQVVTSHIDRQLKSSYHHLATDGAEQSCYHSNYRAKPWHINYSTGPYLGSPISQTAISKNISKKEELKREFKSLVNEWHKERAFISSVTEIAMCKSYQRIIGMGKDVLPFIIYQLKEEGENPDHWFWALKAITGENAVHPEHRGNMKKMAEDWINKLSNDEH